MPVHELFELPRALRLPPGEHVIFGSGPLVVRGVIDAASDLDVLCRDGAWDAVCALAKPKYIEQWDVELVSLYDDRLTFGRTWAIGEANEDEIIDSAETIDGLPFAPLEYVVAYKMVSGCPKDLLHLRALERYEADRQGPGDALVRSRLL